MLQFVGIQVKSDNTKLFMQFENIDAKNVKMETERKLGKYSAILVFKPNS